MAKISKRRSKKRATQSYTPEVFPIVGIGASAGELEAFEVFLKQVPPQSGVAFVAVPHLDPASKGSLIELLQRTPPMPVAQAKDGVRVECDHVDVIAWSKGDRRRLAVRPIVSSLSERPVSHARAASA